jgi:arylsulfatase A-like enzyme
MRLIRLCLGVLLVALLAPAVRADRPPNFVIIFCDDMGYADPACFGNKDVPTPHIDRIAKEGIQFTDFYVGQPICSASRAALMTGCYPNRVGILGALGPMAKIGISDREVIIPQVLKKQGYATAIIGKWHLGREPDFLPTHHGFDEYFGIPYSHDMGHRPNNKNPELPLMEGDKVIEEKPDISQLTTRYTERAVDYIGRNKDHPFFLYLAHNLPHVPLGVSDKFKGKSKRGLYGDVTMEIDWSVGQVLDAIKANRLDDHTLVMFASDNGPWLVYGDHAGRADPLREGKMTTFDGGCRTPCAMRWPGVIRPGQVSHEIVRSMDVLPTFAKLAGTAAPTDRIIDGNDISPLLKGETTKSPDDAYFYYWGKDLQAVRHGKWKLHVAHDYIHPDPVGSGGKPGKTVKLKIPESLFDMETDPSEQHDLAAAHPEIVKELSTLLEQCRQDMGDGNRKGKNVREPGRVDRAQADGQVDWSNGFD